MYTAFNVLNYVASFIFKVQLKKQNNNKENPDFVLQNARKTIVKIYHLLKEQQNYSFHKQNCFFYALIF